MKHIFRHRTGVALLASLLSLASFHAPAQPATIPSAYLKTRFNQFTNAVTTNGIGGTNAGGIAIAANSAIQFASITPGSVSNWTMLPLNRARGFAGMTSIQGTNLAAGTNLVVFNFAVRHDGTNFSTTGPGGLEPFSSMAAANGSNVVWTPFEFGFDQFPIAGPFVNGVLQGAPGNTNNLGASFGIINPITQVFPLDNFQYILLLSATNIGSQPVWLTTNGCWYTQFP